MTVGRVPRETVGDVGGRSVVLAYASVAAEYEALQSHAAMFDRSHRGRVRILGTQAAAMVNGLVTNDVAGLASGQGCYAAALTAKGKIIADVRAFVDGDSVLTDAPPRAAAAWAEMIKKFVNPRSAPHVDETAALRTLGIFGATSRVVVAAVTGVPAPALTALSPYEHATVRIGEDKVLVVRSPELAMDGFELIMPTSAYESLWESAVANGAVPAGLDAWEIARVEAGRPEWGLDIDDTTIPQEANFDELHAISYTKGCYVGQETVARVHFRGHVNKHLRGLTVEDAGTAPPPFAATLHEESGNQVGDVRTGVVSPRLGGIALAMVRREVALGTTLIARWPSEGGTAESMNERRVTVGPLPFAQP